MEIGFTFEAAKPKGQREPADQPTQVSMRPREVTQKSPSTDQKRVRRAMQRRAVAADDTRAEPCPKCGRPSPLVLAHPDAHIYACPKDGDFSLSVTKKASVEAGTKWDLARGVGELALRANPLVQVRIDRGVGQDYSSDPFSEQPDHRDAQDARQNGPEGSHEAPSPQQVVPVEQTLGDEGPLPGRHRHPSRVTEGDAPTPGRHRAPQERRPVDTGRGLQYDFSRFQSSHQRQATQFDVRADALVPGSMVRTPTGQTVTVQQVRSHETNGNYVYVDTDAGTTTVQRSEPFPMVTTNSSQQEIPGYGRPGGNFTQDSGSPTNSAGGSFGDNSAPGMRCPNCAQKTLRQQGQNVLCANCGYTGGYGGSGGHGYGTNPSVINNFSSKKPTNTQVTSMRTLCRNCHSDMIASDKDDFPLCQACGGDNSWRSSEKAQRDFQQDLRDNPKHSARVPTVKINDRYTTQHNSMSAIARRARSVLSTPEENQ